MKNQLEILELKNENNSIEFDFFIGNKQLSKLLNINRYDLAFCSFDLDVFEVDKTKFPHYNRKKINKRFITTLLGNENPENQFGTNRIVLYRCHCGADYCGVISFQLQINRAYIIWKDIRFENEHNFELEMKEREINPIKELKFDRIEYETELEKYLSNYLPI